MNTKDNWQTTVTIHDDHRAAVWGRIFPGARMPIWSIVPSMADLPGHPGASVYFLDLNAITDQQRDQLVQALAEMFGMDPDEISQDMKALGVPILVENTSAQSTDHSMLTAQGDDDLPQEDDDDND